jgi:hypothetical protein
MNVAVVEAGENGSTFCVEDTSAAADESGYLRIVTDEQNTIAADSQRFRAREPRIHSQDVRVADDEVGGGGGIGAAAHGGMKRRIEATADSRFFSSGRRALHPEFELRAALAAEGRD